MDGADINIDPCLWFWIQKVINGEGTSCLKEKVRVLVIGYASAHAKLSVRRSHIENYGAEIAYMYASCPWCIGSYSVCVVDTREAVVPFQK